MVLSQQVYKNVFKTITANTISEKKNCFTFPKKPTSNFLLTLGRTPKFIPPPWYKGWVGGGGLDGTPPRSFWCVAGFRNDFALSWKPLIFLIRWSIFYEWWRRWRRQQWSTSPTMIAILAAIFFLQELKIRLKPREIVILLCFTWKIT